MITTTVWSWDGIAKGDYIPIQLHFGPENVNRLSTVVASICELTGDSPFVGAATMEVHNIAPADGGQVDFVVAILWSEDLPFRLNIAVHNIV